ncbi:uncharacterized protein [Clytia hemisphaerica]|uniref:XK-related protein n=2 Tax=Clytia hemisphaerica TaxID=252671 RepID=A0A7M5WXP6_9CNID|eukprot:TCONS_00017592-protein
MMEKTTGHIISTLLCIFFSLLDNYTDIAQSVIHFCNHKRWYGHLTMALVVAPALINSVYTACMFYCNKGRIVHNVKFPYPKVVYVLCFLLHGHYARQIIWIYALRTKALNERLAKELVSTGRDMSFYLEIFLESMPQMMLQLYIMTVIYGELRLMGCITLFTSFVATSWGLLLLYNDGKERFFAFLINGFWLASRVLSLAVFSSIRRFAIFAILSVHFLFVLPLWFYESKRHPLAEERLTRRGFCHTFVSDFFFAILYAVCNTVTPMITRYYFPLSFMFIIENVVCAVTVYYFGEVKRIVNGEKAYIKFKNWPYASTFMVGFYTVTIIAFLLTLTVQLIKCSNRIDKTFMQSNIRKIISKIRPIEAIKKSVFRRRGTNNEAGLRTIRSES